MEVACTAKRNFDRECKKTFATKSAKRRLMHRSKQRARSPFAERTLWNFFAGVGAGHSGLMLAARITFAHFSASLARNFPNSAGGFGGSTNPPRSTRRALMAASEMAKLISLLSRSTTAAGVFFGAPKPSHELAS